MSQSPGLQHYIVNESGIRIGLTEVPASTTLRGPVLLAHGTFSNHRSCRGLAQYLGELGFDCWLLDFQGHGISDSPAVEPSFESMSLMDSHAAIRWLRQRYPAQALNWVGHSGGGLAVLMHQLRYTDAESAIDNIVTIGSQATHAASARYRNRIAIHAARIATWLLRSAPGNRLGLGPENEYATVMQQWYRWNLSGQWLGNDNFDYAQALPRLDQPCLMLAGSADRFIAPPIGCQFLYDCYGGADKTFSECGTASGYLEDYNHARLISSRSASREIWPLIGEWLLARTG